MGVAGFALGCEVHVGEERRLADCGADDGHAWHELCISAPDRGLVNVETARTVTACSAAKSHGHHDEEVKGVGD